jgi:DNA-binding NarL/FixJ family response regulator
VSTGARRVLRTQTPIALAKRSIVFAAALFAVVVTLRFAIDEGVQGVLLLLAVPVGIVSATRGVSAGVVAAVIASAIAIGWNMSAGYDYDAADHGLRLVVFAWVAILPGLVQTRSPQLAARRPPAELERLLSRRELEVLGLMAEGATNLQIAQRLFISEGTVKSHVKHILRKLDVANRTEASHQYMSNAQPDGD